MTNPTKIEKEFDKLIYMIQLSVTAKASNYETYKDKVTNYRNVLYEQSMKIRKMFQKD